MRESGGMKMAKSPTVLAREDEGRRLTSSIPNVCWTHLMRAQLAGLCGDEGVAR